MFTSFAAKYNLKILRSLHAVRLCVFTVFKRRAIISVYSTNWMVSKTEGWNIY
jgi:hypothetical protein